MGTLIRHARPAGVAAPILLLAVAMVQTSFRTPLVAAVGRAPLPEPGFRAASMAAIALPAITVRTNPEHRVATTAAANPLPENYFAMSRHPCARAGLDNGNRSWQVRTSFDVW